MFKRFLQSSIQQSVTRNLLLTGLLGSVILFDAGSNMAGFLFSGEQLTAGAEAASSTSRITGVSLREVMPEATSFSERIEVEGEIPVWRGYRDNPDTGEKTLIGYVLFTPDAPPEVQGYSAPIDVLVGMDLNARVTGIKVIRYVESIRYTWGDFLDVPEFQAQYIGKHAGEKFSVGNDVDGIARATITVKAMSRGIRNAMRRVANAYLR